MTPTLRKTSVSCRLIATAFSFAVLVLVANCALVSKANEKNLARVRTGISSAELVDAMGEPRSKTPTSLGEEWRYEVYMKEGASSFPYVALVRDGRVVRFGTDTDNARADSELSSQRAQSFDANKVPVPIMDPLRRIDDNSAPIDPIHPGAQTLEPLRR